MRAAEPYTVEIQLARGRNTTHGTFDLTLVDRDRSGIASSTVIGLDLGGEHLALRRGGSLTASDFCRRFLRGEPCGAEEGLAFGRLLHEQLFKGSTVSSLWREIRSLRRDRPLRVELILPEPPEPLLADLPFELLADEEGFLFRRLGHTLVRAIQGSRGEHVTLGAGTRALCAWANPLIENEQGERAPLRSEIFSAHEGALAEHGDKLGWKVSEPCREATRETLAARLAADQPAIVSLIAHGSARGGALLLHNAGDPERPRDLGEPVDARDLAHDFKIGGVQVALLWSCHGARRHPVGGGVAEALLRESHGGLAAVIASHAALRAEETATVARALFRAWKGTAKGDLERALAEARHALGEGDLQWAAPVYYARPLALRSVTLEERVRAWVAVTGPPEAPGGVEGAPRRADYFRGRDDDRARIAALLREARLVNVVGMPGIGKTELTLAVANDLAPGFQRAIWVSLEGRGGIEVARADLATRFGREPEDCKDDRDIAAAIGGARALLVLDNAEDLLRSTADKLKLQGLVGMILAQCPGVSVLLSSRRTMGSPQGAREEVYRLDRLPAPHDEEAFLAAAGARLPPEEQGSEELLGLVKMLDGHPQSLVLVAGQVGQGMSLAFLKERVAREGADAIVSAELLDADDLAEVTDAALRAKRLVSSLNLSFLPLVKANPGASEMFAWLGNFPGGVPEVLLSAIFGEGAGEQAAVLERLHLMEKRGQDRRAGLPAPVRWYAKKQQESLITGERAETLLVRSWEALAEWLETHYQTLSEHHAHQVHAAYERTSPDKDTFAEMLAVAQRHPEAESASKIGLHAAKAMQALSTIMSHSEPVEAVIALCERAAPHLAHLGKPAVAHAQRTLGSFYVRDYRYKEAEVAYRRAGRLFENLQDYAGEVETAIAVAEVYHKTRRDEEAEGIHRSLLSSGHATVCRAHRAQVLVSLGELYAELERHQDAEGAYAEAIAIYRSLGNIRDEASTRLSLGALSTKAGRASDAEMAIREALSAYTTVGDRRGESHSQFTLGNLYAHTNRPAEAMSMFTDAVASFQATANLVGEAGAHVVLGGLHLKNLRFKQAEDEYQEALSLYRTIGQRRGEANAQLGIGAVHIATGRTPSGEALLENAALLYRQIGDLKGEQQVLTVLSVIDLMSDRTSLAEPLWKRHLEASIAAGDRKSEGTSLLWLALLHDTSGHKDDRAREALLSAEEALEATDNMAVLFALTLCIGLNCVASGQVSLGLRYLAKSRIAFRRGQLLRPLGRWIMATSAVRLRALGLGGKSRPTPLLPPAPPKPK